MKWKNLTLENRGQSTLTNKKASKTIRNEINKKENGKRTSTERKATKLKIVGKKPTRTYTAVTHVGLTEVQSEMVKYWSGKQTENAQTTGKNYYRNECNGVKKEGFFFSFPFSLCGCCSYCFGLLSRLRLQAFLTNLLPDLYWLSYRDKRGLEVRWSVCESRPVVSAP